MFLFYIKNAARPCSPRLFLFIITIFRLSLSAAARSDKCVWDIFYSFVKKLTAADGAAIGRAAQQSGGRRSNRAGGAAIGRTVPPCMRTYLPQNGQSGIRKNGIEAYDASASQTAPPRQKLPRASVIRKAAGPAPRARHIPIGAPPRRGRPQAPTAPRPGRPAGATRAVRARFGRKATTVRKDMYAT